MKKEIPDRLTFKVKEVTSIARLDARVLEFWEKEFCCFNPVVNRSGEKFYTKKDLELILIIKEWLIGEKKDKNEVRELLKGISPDSNPDIVPEETKTVAKSTEKLQIIKRNLQEILTILNKDDKS